METLLSISIALIAGLFLTRVIKNLNLPSVTAYLIAGILVGPYFLGKLSIPGIGFTSYEKVEHLKIMSEVALGFIAFAIGNEFRLKELKKTGKQATIIAFSQALTATLFVDLALIGLHFILGGKLSIPAAITLGAIATATAPAATLMVVKQYKAKGPVVDMLLPIVALDDAIGLVIFAISFGIAKALTIGSFSMTAILIEPLLEVILSLMLGAILGFALTFCEGFFKSSGKRLSLAVTFVIMTVGLSMMTFNIGGIHIGFSSLLVCMMLGTIFCNRSGLSADLMAKTDKWTEPLFVLFFVLSGAELQLSVFSDTAIIGIGIVFILVRSLGKYFGTYASAAATKCSENIKKYLGITLLPQAGVALGMCIKAEALGADGSLIKNIILFAVLVYELVGPYLTKVALTRAGDIVPENTAENSRLASKAA